MATYTIKPGLHQQAKPVQVVKTNHRPRTVAEAYAQKAQMDRPAMSKAGQS